MQLTQRAPLRALLRCDYRLTSFCCCSLEVGVFCTALLLFINACLAFAGEAALYLGFLAAVATQITGTTLPPGSELGGALHGLFIGLGLYALVGALLGFVALARRDLRCATGLYVIMLVNVVLSIAVALISWFAGSPFSLLLAQLPTFALNIYLLLVVGSFRAGLQAEARGGELVEGGGGGVASASSGSKPAQTSLETGVDASDLDLDLDDDLGEGSGPPTAKGPGAGKAKSAVTVVIGSDLDDDEDIGRGGAGAGHSGGSGAPGAATSAAAALAQAQAAREKKARNNP